MTMWPRFLLLGVWVTMLFLYAGLARFEESRMTARFGDEYLQYKATKAAFPPGSPVHRLFQAGTNRPEASIAHQRFVLEEYHVVVASFQPLTKEVLWVIIPQRQNNWGPQVVMPLF